MGEIITYTGKYINPVDPNPEKFDIRDVAHALSLICRGNGQVVTFFSVAQHCLLCAAEAEARGLSTRVALACLLHDASECYLSDVPRPFKEMLPEYNRLEEEVLNRIYTRYLGSPLTEEEQAQMKEIDDDLLWYDMKNLLRIDVKDPEPDVKIKPDQSVRPFEEVERQYLETFERLSAALKTEVR